MMSDAALKLSSVSKLFESHGRVIKALDDVSFEIQAGKVTGLIGPDGAGKTTLMRLISGLLVPASGAIEVVGIDVISDPLAVQSQLGYMPQRFGLYDDLTVQQNLDLYADLQNIAYKDRQPRFDQLMNMTGMSPFTKRLAGNLSGGMKQKLGLACTLLRSPKLLILDEPTVGVDPVSRRELWEIIYQQVSQVGMSVLLSTAYMDEAERCDEVVLLHEGKLLMQGKPKDLSQPLSGRTFHISVEGVRHRTLQQVLSNAPDVLDALIEGEGVRVVMEQVVDAKAIVLPQVLTQETHGTVSIDPVKPRFEDAFIARLKTKSTITQQTTIAPLSVSSSADKAVISVDNLTRTFGEFIAVNKISFNVKKGEVFGLLGANGAGKSTAFRMLCGLLPVSSGKVSVAGLDLRVAAADARRRIGYMAQKFSLYSDLSVTQNLNFFSSAYGLSGKQQKQRLAWAITTFELENYKNTNAGNLPLGYKQRLSFAAALMHEPEILFLDEPTSGVDPLARREFWERTNHLAEMGVTILVTTHFMDEANYCDHLVIMEAGRILAAGTPLDMKNLARNDEQPDPSMEDAFIYLLNSNDQKHQAVIA
ncbi:ABC transporter ATP-binding protein [Leucothrix arctica]|uniref:ABC transporter ATP-binding protein n=2 Tax=Leucothrix arctica TaxID=1481894 RepID=A0A317C5C8_9GAMM|nr:ABC transporter ATP-binding protein [Leucothrix arctica]